MKSSTLFILQEVLYLDLLIQKEISINNCFPSDV